MKIRNKLVVCCITNIHVKKLSFKFNVKNIEEFDSYYYLDKNNLSFLTWVSKYNSINIGMSLKLILADYKFLIPKKNKFTLLKKCPI